jgi:hypothetical protein
MSIGAPREGVEFTPEDVGNFLQNKFGDRIVEGGQKWDVRGVTVIPDEESGMIVVGNLNPEQFGTNWVGGKSLNASLSELLFKAGFRPFYSTNRLSAMIPADQFSAVLQGISSPVADEASVFAENRLGDVIDRVLADRDFPIG